MSLWIDIFIALVGICIIGLGIAVQKYSLNIMGILALFVGTVVLLFAGFIGV